MGDCQRALQANPQFAKAYNRMSKCHIALGDLAQASISLQKAIELEPGNQANRKDQKALGDLKIIDSLVQKAVKEENYDKAVTNLSQLIGDCKHAVGLVALKIECLMRAFQFEQANTYSASIQKSGSDLANHPLFLMWRGKALLYTGADVLGKKHLQQAM
jgi:tetratricopeptide (TPR) repeat protein